MGCIGRVYQSWACGRARNNFSIHDGNISPIARASMKATEKLADMVNTFTLLHVVGSRTRIRIAIS